MLCAKSGAPAGLAFDDLSHTAESGVWRCLRLSRTRAIRDARPGQVMVPLVGEMAPSPRQDLLETDPPGSDMPCIYKINQKADLEDQGI